jgi:hypothetical protein
MKNILLVIAFIASIPFSASIAQEQCMLIPLSLEQRLDQSSLVIEGKVLSQSSFWDRTHQHIYTSNIVKVYKLFKGVLQTDNVEIITEGGIVQNEMQLLSSTLALSKDETGIFFLYPTANLTQGKSIASYMVYSSLQGFIKYDLVNRIAIEPFKKYDAIQEAREVVTATTNKPFKVISEVDAALKQAEQPFQKFKTTAVPVITSFSPASVSGGTGTLLTINGTNFGATQGSGFVEFPNANDGGASYVQPLGTDYITWTNTQIVVRVPSTVVNPSGCAGTGTFRVTNSDPNTGLSPTPLTITWTWTNIPDGSSASRPDLVTDNGTGGYTFQYYTGFATNVAAVTAFSTAMTTWCNTGMNWTIGTNSAVNVAASDGVNIVRFDVGSELPAGVLGRLTSYYSGCGPIGGPFTWYTTEMDIVFDDGVSWQYGPALPSFSQYDFQSVALHELGHGMQLNHVINTADVMHYAISNGQTRRTLNTDDITGGTAVVNASTLANACGQSPLIAVSCTPLSAKILYFNGRLDSKSTAVLSLAVADESNITSMNIEKSVDGSEFQNLESVQLTGNGSYTIKDNSFENTALYRIAVQEKNNSSYYSNIIQLRATGDDKLSVYPNPVKDQITIKGKDLNNARLTITAADGKVVLSQVLLVSKKPAVEIKLPQLVEGIYFYKVEGINTISGKFYKE